MTYRDSADAERPRCIPFGALSPETQEALQAALRGRDDPLLVEWDRMPWAHWGWAVLGLLGLLLAGVVAAHRFGDLGASPRSPVLQGLAVGLGLLVALLSAPLTWRLRRLNAIPRGVFLLPFDLVDTRSDHVWIFPVSRIHTIQQHRDRLVLGFEGGTSYSFHASVPELKTQIEQAQGHLLDLAARGDQEGVLRGDPFALQREGWPGDVLPQAPLALAWRGALATASLLGLTTGLLLTPRIQLASDQRGLTQAEREMDDDALLRYVREDGSLAKEADEIRWKLAQRARDDGGLIQYMRTGLAHREEAEKLLVERIREAPSEARLRRFLDSGGKGGDWVDEVSLRLTLQQGDEAALRAYLRRGGKASERIERELLPLAMLRQAKAVKNIGLLVLMASDPDTLSAQQRTVRGEFSEAIRQEARATLVQVQTSELRAYKEQHGSQHPWLQALWTVAERQIGKFEPGLVEVEARLVVSSSAKDLHRPSPERFERFPLAVVRMVSPMVPPCLLRVEEKGKSDATPVARLLLQFDSFYIPEQDTEYHHTLQGYLALDGGRTSVLLQFSTHCSPWSSSGREGILQEALRGALTGRPAPCPLY